MCGSSKGFKDTFLGIRLLKKAGIRINLNTTFTKSNVADMEQIVKFAKEEHIPIRMARYTFPPVRNHHKITSINLTPEEAGRASAYFDALTLDQNQIVKRKEYLRKCINRGGSDENNGTSEVSSCMAGKGAFWVSWDGNMYPCGMLPDYSVNLKEISFQDAWKSIVGKASKMLLPQECSVCKYHEICPSCAAVSQSINHATDMVPREMCIWTSTYVESFLNLS